MAHLVFERSVIMTRAHKIKSTFALKSPPRAFERPTRAFRSVLRSGALALLLAACASTSEPEVEQAAEEVPVPAPEEVLPPAPIKIAFLAPLSGGAAAIGEDLLAAAELALFARTEDVVLLPRDTMGTAASAETAIRGAIDDGAEIIVGPLFAAAAEAVGPIATEEGLKVLALSNDASIARPDLFVLGFRPEEQVDRIMAFARSRNLPGIAALVPDNEYGRRALTAWQANQPEPPVDPAILPEASPRALTYSTEITELSTAIREFTRYDARLGRAEARAQAGQESGLQPEGAPKADIVEAVPFEREDAMLVADGGARLRGIAALFAFYDVQPGDVQLLGTELWRDDPQALREPSLQGGWLASVDPALEERFAARFQQSFGRRPHELAALAFDAVTLAIRTAGIDRTFPNTLLTSAAGYDGETGIFRLRPDGLTDHGLAILQVDGPRLQVIDPMPTEFQPDLVQ